MLDLRGKHAVVTGAASGIEHRRDVVPVSPEAWLAYWTKRFAPSLSGAMARLMVKQARVTGPGRAR